MFNKPFHLGKLALIWTSAEVLLLEGKKIQCSESNLNNYQHISALTVLLKLPGDLMQSEWKCLLSACNVLTPFQASFWPALCCAKALHTITRKDFMVEIGRAHV